MDCCNSPETHLFVLSFTVGSESGLALVAANDARQAFQVLQNSGSRNCEGYTLIQCRNIGMTAQCHFGLLMESYVNALEAYDAIMHVANMLKGEKGDDGDLAYIAFYLDADGNLVYDSVGSDEIVDFALDDYGNLCVEME